MRFVHAADLHIDAPMRNVPTGSGHELEQFRLATRRAFRNVVTYCIDQSADLLLLAGDIFDGEIRDARGSLYFSEMLGELAQAGCRVAMVLGNHDSPETLGRALTLPEGSVKLFSGDQPETWDLPDLGVCVHGQSYPRKVVSENLARAFPAPRVERFNIGLLHCNVAGSSGHENYAPCSLDDLVVKGYDYWALGHVHEGRVLSERPHVAYPGNTQGRHIKETGPRGVLVGEVKDGALMTLDQEPMDVVRWEQIEIDATGVGDVEDLLDAVREAAIVARNFADGRPLMVRLKVSGRSVIHPQLAAATDDVRQRVREVLGTLGSVFLERLILEVKSAADATSSPDEAHPLEDMIRSVLADWCEKDARLKGVMTEFQKDFQKIGLSASARDIGELRGRVEDAAEHLLARLNEEPS